MRGVFSLTLLPLFAVLLATGLAVASTDDSTTDTKSVSLQPGDNFIGWVGQPIYADELFEVLPQAQLIYEWNAEIGRFRFAAPRVRGDLYRVNPGMGIVIRIGGDEIVVWSRPVDRPAPLVFLEPGWNLVAWSRGDGVSLTEATSNLDPGEFDVVAPEGATTLDFGDTVWINTPHAIGWAQISDVPIDLIATEMASAVNKNAVVTEVLAAIDWYRQEFELEIGAHMTLYLHFDCEELISDALPKHDVLGDLGCFGSYHPFSAWAGSDYIVVDLGALYMWGNSWRPHEYFRDVYTHELAHVLQYQLLERSPLDEPAWLVEGVAMWMTIHRKILADESTWLSSSWRRQLEYSSKTPTLSSVEDRPDYTYEGRNPHIYWLGLDAAHLLQDMTDPDSLFEYWRVLGANYQTEESSDSPAKPWEVAFHQVFGVTASDFYERFEDWKLTRADEILWSPDGYPLIHGIVLDPEGNPAEDGVIQADPDVTPRKSGFGGFANEDGQTVFRASLHSHRYIFYVSALVGRSCWGFWGRNGWFQERAKVEPVLVEWVQGTPGGPDGALGIDGRRIITLQIPQELCEEADE